MNFRDAANFDKITKAIEKLNNRDQNQNDDRFWRPEKDKTGNGYAVIRFLPTPQVDGIAGLPWVHVMSYGFQGPSGLWYIENSPLTIGGRDPVTEMNNKLWKGTPEDQTIARGRKLRKNWISNVYIVEDPANPANNGTVKLFRYGIKIYEKLQAALKPEFIDEKPMNPFDLLNGADFKLKIRTLDGYMNYDKSEFAAPGPLKGFDEDQLDEIWKKTYSLLDFVSADKFKSYDELKVQLERVLGASSDIPNMVPAPAQVVQLSTAKASTPHVAKAEVDDEIPPFDTDDDDGPDMDYFKRLAQEA